MLQRLILSLLDQAAAIEEDKMNLSMVFSERLNSIFSQEISRTNLRLGYGGLVLVKDGVVAAKLDAEITLAMGCWQIMNAAENPYIQTPMLRVCGKNFSITIS